MQLSCPMEAWKKSGLCIWKCSHSPAGLIFLTIPQSCQPHTTVGTLKAIPWKLTVCLFLNAQGATQDSWNKSQLGPDSPQMSPSSPMHLWARALFPGSIVVTKSLLGPKNVLDVESRGKYISLTNTKLCQESQRFYGKGQRKKFRQLCRVLY